MNYTQKVSACNREWHQSKTPRAEILHICRYISSDDVLLKRRKAFAHQPVTWFRNPYAQLVLVCSCAPALMHVGPYGICLQLPWHHAPCAFIGGHAVPCQQHSEYTSRGDTYVQVSGESVDEYKQQVREGLRRLLDPPGDAAGGPAESIVVYIKPSNIDPFSKGPGKAISLHSMSRVLSAPLGFARISAFDA